ncbi:MAG: class I SAM-dependent methyltransferase, partial [Flavobacteriaceae bacterium]|nr:class I SAM-dependent methyltransferase [Flavobacteriaceae bacterium]
YFMFSRAFVPFIGSIFSKNKLAYNYLQKSAEKFPCGHVFVSILKECGFKTIYIKTQMFGAASIYVAKK